ncbi:hypothetical protein [Diaminobutyricimonas aerilata]|nr:hypothetical protein [Diaminobutyricimonas aerilata]
MSDSNDANSIDAAGTPEAEDTEQGHAHEKEHGDDEAMAMPEELRDLGQGTSSEGGAPLP